MSSDLQKNLPLGLKYGLHYGYFGCLPTLEEVFRVKTCASAFQYNLLPLDASSLLTGANLGYDLCIDIPTVGFCDPALDYEITPWFAIPLVVNGQVSEFAQKDRARADLQVTDLMDNSYPIYFDEKGRVNYEKIANEIKSPCFTTLKSLQYRFPLKNIMLGEGLQTLPDHEYEGKILFLLPKIYADFLIQCSVQEGKRALDSKTYQIKQKPNTASVLEVQSHWKGNQDQGQLSIEYACTDDFPFNQAFVAEMSFKLPTQSNLKYLLYGTQTWLNTHENQQPGLTQYYGLSDKALQDILQVLISYEVFEEELSRPHETKEQMQSNGFNQYQNKPQACYTLYQYLLSGVINRSVPLYALKEYSLKDEEVFEAISQLDIQKWPLSDQVVYKQMITQISNSMPSAQVVWDAVDSYLSFGPGDIAGKILIETDGAVLETNPKIQAELNCSFHSPDFPITLKAQNTQEKELSSSKLSDKKTRKPGQQPRDLK